MILEDWLSSCSVYINVQAEDAYIFAADRWGINLLAKVEESKAGDTKQDEPSSQSSAEKKWREFRFAFSQEVRNTTILYVTCRNGKGVSEDAEQGERSPS